MRIPGSASGLGRGSFVLFNGVKVGDVKRVYIDVDNPTVAIADTEIDRMTPITKSTQADIGLAGLTGQANIELKGADPKEVKLLDQAEKEGRIPEIVANPSAVTNLLQTAQNIFTRADKVLSELEGFTRDVRGPLTRTVKNVETFSDALAKNSDGIDKFLSAVSSLSDQLKAVTGIPACATYRPPLAMIVPPIVLAALVLALGLYLPAGVSEVLGDAAAALSGRASP